jgi:hypothetical protein
MSNAIAASLSDMGSDRELQLAIQASLTESPEDTDWAMAVAASLAEERGRGGRPSPPPVNVEADAAFARQLHEFETKVAAHERERQRKEPAPFLRRMFEATDEWSIVQQLETLSSNSTTVKRADDSFEGERIVVRVTLHGGGIFEVVAAAWRPPGRAEYALEVVSIAPYSGRASSFHSDIYSVPSEHAVAKLAELFAKLACERDERVRLESLVKRLEAASHVTHTVAVLNSSRVERQTPQETYAEARQLHQHLEARNVLRRDLSLRDAILHAIVAADENVRSHCLVCARIIPPHALSESVQPLHPHTCGRDECVKDELNTLAHMDAFSLLSYTPTDVLQTILCSAFAATLTEANKRKALLPEIPAGYNEKPPAPPSGPIELCGEDCTDAHAAAACTRCNSSWGLHSGHMCPPDYRSRGAWLRGTPLSTAMESDGISWLALTSDLNHLTLHVSSFVNCNTLRQLRLELSNIKGEVSEEVALNLSSLADPLAELATAAQAWDDAVTVIAQSAQSSAGTVGQRSWAASSPPAYVPSAKHGATGASLVGSVDDPDRLFRTLWWAVRSVRCDFEEVPLAAVSSKGCRLVSHWTPSNARAYAILPHKEPQSRVGAPGSTTRFFFHGTQGDTVHSILRTGLQVLSRTPHQKVGHAHGEGIYLAPDATISLSYSSRNPHRNQKCGVMFVCEVEEGPHLTNKSESVFVCTDASKVQLRYMILFHLAGTARFVTDSHLRVGTRGGATATSYTDAGASPPWWHVRSGGGVFTSAPSFGGPSGRQPPPFRFGPPAVSDAARMFAPPAVSLGGGRVCGEDCTLAHTGDSVCIRCGHTWNTHSGHKCPPHYNSRGAWSLPASP